VVEPGKSPDRVVKIPRGLKIRPADIVVLSKTAWLLKQGQNYEHWRKRNNKLTLTSLLNFQKFIPVTDVIQLIFLFVCVQAHFHWGVHSKQGSEHFVDGRSFPLGTFAAYLLN
jgi:hypothetical protein